MFSYHDNHHQKVNGRLTSVVQFVSHVALQVRVEVGLAGTHNPTNGKGYFVHTDGQSTGSLGVFICTNYERHTHTQALMNTDFRDHPKNKPVKMINPTLKV